jgi:hypothetical protein
MVGEGPRHSIFQTKRANMPALAWASEKRLNVSVFQRRIRTLPKAGRRVRRGALASRLASTHADAPGTLSRFAILSGSG